ncbi:AzlC family ABC transporter permease [Mangrovicoccus algicola]|uniref:AzlC family ABC transporter permease n=1 Tax=Mangrovicoccus algicola TaxID=2771008 RepID=A0A8J6ZAK6_9RHOB|nr:AzlC family ABC transporter permease [Mangrovicoccus algicola]MBE3639440.1 AzlC family ABC transporter permease [Mangrovicoccus algicola]
MQTGMGAAIRRGLVDSIPFLIVIVPFGMLFGVAGAEAGLPIAQVMGFTVLVIAGAAQFTALQLLQDNAPLAVILLTSLAVNLRMAMYSAALAPHLGKARLWQRGLVAYLLVDQSYALAQAAYEREPGRPLPQKLGYFFATMSTIAPVWFLATYCGARMGAAVPEGIALDFAVPVTFLALVAPGLKTLAHLAAAGTSVALALALSWMPYSLGLILAAIAAMAAGAQTEIWMERRA